MMVITVYDVISSQNIESNLIKHTHAVNDVRSVPLIHLRFSLSFSFLFSFFSFFFFFFFFVQFLPIHYCYSSSFFFLFPFFFDFGYRWRWQRVEIDDSCREELLAVAPPFISRLLVLFLIFSGCCCCWFLCGVNPDLLIPVFWQCRNLFCLPMIEIRLLKRRRGKQSSVFDQFALC